MMVRFTLQPGDELTEEQKAHLDKLAEDIRTGRRQIVPDEDCPEVSKEKNPLLYAAAMRAVKERNARLRAQGKPLPRPPVGEIL